MKHLKTVNHIGYAVRDIQKTAQYYLDAGWQLSEIYEEEVQQAKIAFPRMVSRRLSLWLL